MLSTTPPKPLIGQQRRFAALPLVDVLVATVVILRCAWLFSALLRSRQLPLSLAEDDFYYYLLPAQNFAWYERLFGWKRDEAMDMGPNGTYQLFSTSEAQTNGGSCGKMAGSMPTHWLYYFSVDGLHTAIERTNSAGGKIFMGPHEVPGGTWIAIRLSGCDWRGRRGYRYGTVTGG